jgi:hypothetical protein
MLIIRDALKKGRIDDKVSSLPVYFYFNIRYLTMTQQCHINFGSLHHNL